MDTSRTKLIIGIATGAFVLNTTKHRSWGARTAKEIRQVAGSDFRDFEYLRELIKMT